MKDWLSAASLGAARRPEKLLCFGQPTTVLSRMGGTRSEGTASVTHGSGGIILVSAGYGREAL